MRGRNTDVDSWMITAATRRVETTIRRNQIIERMFFLSVLTGAGTPQNCCIKLKIGR
jgi:hypothetical protein